MKYTKMLMNMVEELRNEGLHASYIDAGALVTNDTIDDHYYFETGSTINIYKNNELIKNFKTPKGALNYIRTLKS